MAITDTQKVDYLFKKLGFGVTKTDTNSNKVAANESIPSPLLIRGDKIWNQSVNIPGTIPTSSNSIISVYKNETTVECTSDITASTNRTWKTGLTNWISPEFGSTYLVNVYVHTSGDAANAESSGTKLFITGSGNNDEWFFDYQSGVLNFIGTNLPNGINFTGKSVYITGARYVGFIGTGPIPGEDINLGNLAVSDNTITSVNTNANIVLAPDGTGKIILDTTSSLVLPNGTTAQRPTGSASELRYNVDTNTIEYHNGTEWNSLVTSDQVGSSFFQEFSGDGSTTQFSLSYTTTTTDTIVTLNGLIQSPGNAYTVVSGTTLTFTEAPKTDDAIEIRYRINSLSINAIIADNDTNIVVNDDSANIVGKVNNITQFTVDATSATFTGSILGTGSLSSILTSVPSSNSDTGTKGQIAYDASYVYICVATDTWIRASIQNSF